MNALRTVVVVLGLVGSVAATVANPPSGTWDPRFVSYASPTTPADAVEWRGDLVVVPGSYSDVIDSYRVFWAWDGRAWSEVPGPFEDVDTENVRLSGASFWGLAIDGDELVVSASRLNWAHPIGDAPRHFFSVGRWDGKRWTRLGGDTPGIVYDVAVVDGTTYVNGRFPTGPDESADGVLRWTGQSWESIVDDGTEIEREIFTDGDDLLVSGSVRTRDGRVLEGLSAWNGDAWRNVAPSPGPIRAITRWRGDLVAGVRQRTTGLPTLQRWTGNAWEPLGGGLPGSEEGNSGFFFWSWSVSDLRVHGDVLRVTGLFELPGAPGLTRVATWDGSQWTDDDAEISGTVAGFATWRGRTLVYGGFSFADGRHVRGLAQETRSGWSELRTGDGLIGSARHMEVRDDRLWVFGDAWAAGGARVTAPVTWDGSTWTDVFPDASCGRPVNLIDRGDETYAVGRFRRTEDGESRTAPLARVTAEGLEPLFDVAWPDHASVTDAVVWRDQIAIITDVFPDDAPRFSRVILWDGSTVRFFDTEERGAIHTLITYRDLLIVGGRFFEMDGQRALMLAAYDGVAWGPLDGDVGGEVHALEVVDDALVVGGHFNVVGTTVDARSIARWDGASWSAIGTGFYLDHVPEFGPRVAAIYDLVVHEGELVVTGTFDRAGDVPIDGLARWDGNAWQPFVGDAVDPDFWFRRGTALASYDGHLYVNGFFVDDGLTTSMRFSRWIAFSPGAQERGISLDSIAPNPMNPRTQVRFSVAEAGPVRVDLYDARGRHVRRLVDAPFGLGEHAVGWDGTDAEGRAVASGVYFVRVRSERADERGKVTLVR